MADERKLEKHEECMKDKELNLDDLDDVVGGQGGLHGVNFTKTSKITENMKGKI